MNNRLIFRLNERSFGSQILILFFLIVLGALIAISLGGILGLLFGGTKSLSLLAAPDFSNPKTVMMMKFFQILSQLGIFVFPAFAFAYLYQKDYRGFLGIKQLPSIKIFLIALVAISFSLPFIGLLVEWNQAMVLPDFMAGIEDWMRSKEAEAKQMTEIFLRAGTLADLLLNFIMIGFLAGLGEELLFRGTLQNMILRKYHNPHLAVWLAAIIFSAFHLQFFGFLPRMVLGAFFGYIYLWTNNLWIPAGMHTLFNSITIFGSYLYQHNIIRTDTDELGTSDNPFVIAGSLTLMLLGLSYFSFRTKKSVKVSK